MLKSDSIPRLLLSCFRVFGPKLVVRQGEERWTFVDLWAYARWACLRLLEKGFEAGGLVVVADMSPIRGNALTLGGLCAGGVALVGEWRDAIRNIERFPCVAVFCGTGKGESQCEVMGLVEQDGKNCFFIEEPGKPPEPPKRGLESLKDDETIEIAIAKVGPDSDAILTFADAGGACLLTQKQAMGFAREVAESIGLSDKDRILAVTKPDSAFALLGGLVPAMIAQSQIIFARGVEEFGAFLISTYPTRIVLGKDESDACLEALAGYFEQKIAGWDRIVLEKMQASGFFSSLVRFAYEKGLSGLHKQKGQLRSVAVENKACVNKKAQRLLEALGIGLRSLPPFHS